LSILSFHAMSIAASAVIVPSRRLRLALLCYGSANLGAALALAGGLAGPFRLPGLGAGCCLLAALVLFRALGLHADLRGIDISGLGQLRLTVQLDIGLKDARPELVQLLPGSTVWPCLMLLLLRRQDGVVAVLLLFPDSVEVGQFRPLSVAIRAIASRKKLFSENNKIL
jgi:toxin CptA